LGEFAGILSKKPAFAHLADMHFQNKQDKRQLSPKIITFGESNHHMKRFFTVTPINHETFGLI
jgi:hypothetical protein